MLVFVYVGEVHAEEGIGKPGREGRVGEIGVNDKDGDEREDNTKASINRPQWYHMAPGYLQRLR